MNRARTEGYVNNAVRMRGLDEGSMMYDPDAGEIYKFLFITLDILTMLEIGVK